ncbi:MAG: hypothetical protein OEW62_09305 [Candidatus Bathyarchaeota archaeon]|nr:hypothetical protein [Candidatus Bathyarchaeota archaeon]MDH5596341.1 hypothetical protein [Candidatus Bathyarchaeota archaeon]
MLLTILGVVIGVIGAVILTYPGFKPEDERLGRKVTRKDSKGIQKAINTLSRERPQFWTDRKIYAVGLIVTVVGAIVTISDLLGLINL